MPALRYQIDHQFDAARHAMVETHLRRRGILDRRVLHAIAAVPRELFVPHDLAADSYADYAIELEHGHGQMLPSPYTIAMMIQALRLSSRGTILEVGTGSGYTAAVLSHLARQVFTVEALPELALAAELRLAACGYRRIAVRLGDGRRGWSEHAPYDAILVTASSSSIPLALLSQLALGGRLVMPLVRRHAQVLVRVTCTGDEQFVLRDLGPISLMPLLEHALPPS